MSEFRRKIMMLTRPVESPPSPLLPDGYTELEYLESSGTQYIDTGIVPTVNMDVTVVLQLIATTNARYIFGRYASGGQYFLYISGSYQYGWSCKYKYSGVLPDTSKHTFRLYSDGTTSYFNIDGANVSSNSTATQTSSSLTFTLFRGGGSSVGTGNAQKIYECIINSSGQKMMHLIPAMRDADGVVGMYDIVGDLFLTNVGSGDFNYGTLS